MISLTVERPYEDPFRYYDENGDCYLLFSRREVFQFIRQRKLDLLRVEGSVLRSGDQREPEDASH